jgi:hypothetical protein
MSRKMLLIFLLNFPLFLLLPPYNPWKKNFIHYCYCMNFLLLFILKVTDHLCF